VVLPDRSRGSIIKSDRVTSLFVWLVADGWCWFVLREKYCWLVVGGWFVLREKYCWLVADKPSEQGVRQELISLMESETNGTTDRVRSILQPVDRSPDGYALLIYRSTNCLQDHAKKRAAGPKTRTEY
jgi:hypothetical protein